LQTVYDKRVKEARKKKRAERDAAAAGPDDEIDYEKKHLERIKRTELEN